MPTGDFIKFTKPFPFGGAVIADEVIGDAVDTSVELGGVFAVGVNASLGGFRGTAGIEGSWSLAACAAAVILAKGLSFT
jgi:hypothetical protein